MTALALVLHSVFRKPVQSPIHRLIPARVRLSYYI
jgi:hypothetical protein